MCGAGKDMGPKKPMLLSPDTFAEEAGKAKFTVPADASVLAELYREAVLHGFGEMTPSHTHSCTHAPCTLYLGALLTVCAPCVAQVGRPR